MSTNESNVDQHYGFGGILDRIKSGLNDAGKDLAALQVDDLAPIDAFHTRGREATLELTAMAQLQPDDLVLDVGCGLGGTARHLAEAYGCTVKGIDLTEEYVAVGEELTRMVGLEGKVSIQQGSALEIPFEANIFDVVWTEHVQMNIEAKAQFYNEIGRVLKPGGRFLFHDVLRGPGEAPVYPVPWAETSAISFLMTVEDAKGYMADAGLEEVSWLDKAEPSLAFFKTVFEKIQADGPPPIGIHLLMGDTAGVKLQNYVTNLSENRTAIIMGHMQKI